MHILLSLLQYDFKYRLSSLARPWMALSLEDLLDGSGVGVNSRNGEINRNTFTDGDSSVIGNSNDHDGSGPFEFYDPRGLFSSRRKSAGKGTEERKQGNRERKLEKDGQLGSSNSASSLSGARLQVRYLLSAFLLLDRRIERAKTANPFPPSFSANAEPELLCFFVPHSHTCPRFLFIFHQLITGGHERAWPCVPSANRRPQSS